MYGDPVGASISADEKYCVVFGCGAVIYFIEEPFQNYEYGCLSKQWFEVEADGTVWFEKVIFQDSCNIKLLSEEHLIYDVNIEKRAFFIEKEMNSE